MDKVKVKRVVIKTTDTTYGIAGDYNEFWESKIWEFPEGGFLVSPGNSASYFCSNAEDITGYYLRPVKYEVVCIGEEELSISFLKEAIKDHWRETALPIRHSILYLAYSSLEELFKDIAEVVKIEDDD